MTNNEHPEHVVRGVWVPGWHRLDQSVELGQSGRFWFHASQSGLTNSVDQPGPATLSFFNCLDSAERQSEVRSAKVIGIWHPELGALQRIDTAGLDYAFWTAAGEELIVNAEETPGEIYDTDLKIGQWEVEVLLCDVSAPLEEIV